jgi:glycerophosphoryl diester phosphodiesterase
MVSSSSDIEVIGHEGGGTAPGNTLTAIQQGLDGGADVIEIDVHLTSDGHLITCHEAADHSIEVSGCPVEEQPLSNLQDVYPEAYLPEAYHDEDVLLIRDLLTDTLKGVPLILDVKNALLPPDTSDDLLDSLLELTDLDAWDENVCVASFDHKLLYKLKKHRPEVRLGMTSGSNSLLQREELDRLSPDIWLMHWRYAGVGAVELTEQRGVKLFPWVINKKPLAMKALSVGVNGVVTDHPKRIRETIQSFQSG